MEGCVTLPAIGRDGGPDARRPASPTPGRSPPAPAGGTRVAGWSGPRRPTGRDGLPKSPAGRSPRAPWMGTAQRRAMLHRRVWPFTCRRERPRPRPVRRVRHCAGPRGSAGFAHWTRTVYATEPPQPRAVRRRAPDEPRAGPCRRCGGRMGHAGRVVSPQVKNEPRRTGRGRGREPPANRRQPVAMARFASSPGPAREGQRRGQGCFPCHVSDRTRKSGLIGRSKLAVH